MSMAGEAEEEGEGTDEEAGNAGWVEPHPDALAFPARDHAVLWSDSSSDGERRDEAEATEPLVEPPNEVSAAVGEGAVAKGGSSAPPAPWWKLPMEVLRLWAARAARSACSVPVAVALLGFAVLGRRLYRMRRQSKAVARVRLILDDKKASQFKAQRMLRRGKDEGKKKTENRGYGTLQNVDKDAKCIDGKPLCDYVEVLVNIVLKETTILPRALGRITNLGNATAHCIPWPRKNLEDSEAESMQSTIEQIKEQTKAQAK